jgi:hypothetical protein
MAHREHFASVNGMASLRHRKQNDSPYSSNRTDRDTQRLKDEKASRRINTIQPVLRLPDL